ncbi:AAA family ATPase [Desulfobulbus alkaliphilus]|uniref:AAA family ATPase n=1 Tax=Desulfobulbus alkaliphilus TaxID=869814 RepID=UPI0019630BC9|nr:ATP-binding protein [Desulfobulbus alkaliphilus]MBM9535977.1 ATP-binding protein [Desulfobulbus alkaliphilus]
MDIPDLVKLWVVRLFVPLGGQQKFIKDEGFREDLWANFFGAPEWINDDFADVTTKAVRIHLREVYQKYENTLAGAKPPEQLSTNITRLSSMLGLSETDSRILELAILFHTDHLLDVAGDLLGVMFSSDRVSWVLSSLLKIPVKNVRDALSARGPLASSGLLTINPESYSSLKDKFNVLSDNFVNNLRYSDVDPLFMLRDIILPGKPTTLRLEDFAHIEPELKVLLPFMQHALANHRRGTNILLYGPPGTGKSELSRLLAKEMQSNLFEVSSEDEDGDPINGNRRLRAFRAAQCFFVGQRTMICFDEVEDVFTGNGVSYHNSGMHNKAWINRMLEENTVPAIWISNSVHCLDNAFIRRFNMIIELTVPPKRQREQIILQACQNLSLPGDQFLHLATNEHLAPAVVSRALSVVHCIREQLPLNYIPMAVEQLIHSTLRAQGHKLNGTNKEETLPAVYDPALVNADTDLLAVAEGLKRAKSGRLCLHGLPGTGKTAFGYWLAEQLGLPLVVKRASDLLDMYVGGTERNIASAFAEAQEEGALLLIDEVDNFLQDRRRSQRVWEITEVNEMLVQIERFPGVFVASTNLIDSLDQAAMRRFDLKIRFDALTIDQSCVLLERHCLHLGIAKADANQLRGLASLHGLTPGDFAVVARQHRFRPIEGAGAFIRALTEECGMKDPGQKKAIGFL